MSDSISNQSDSQSSSAAIASCELALQSLCKSILKGRIFRGFYLERRRVDYLNGYRDIVTLHRTEKELEKIVLDIKDKLLCFYEQINPNIWVGITGQPIQGTPKELNASEVRIWTTFEDIPFSQYWFNIKSLRFRDNEVILKLKVVRTVEPDLVETPRTRVLSAVTRAAQNLTPKVLKPPPSENPIRKESFTETSAIKTEIIDQVNSTTAGVGIGEGEEEPPITFNDFVLLAKDWGESIKLGIYNFLSNDITKENIIAFLRFLGLLTVSIFCSSIVVIKYLGIFILRFMFEFSRLTHVLTPITLKIIDVLNKCVGGFYILLAMIWRDLVTNRGQSRQRTTDFRAIEYNRPLYKSIQYNVQSNAQRKREFFSDYQKTE